MSKAVSRSSVYRLLPPKFRNWGGVGPYYIPLFGRMYWGRLEKAMSLVPCEPGSKHTHYAIADLGSGFGVFAAILGNAFPNSNVVAIDNSPIEVMNTSKLICEGHGIQNVTFVRGDVCSTPFRQKTFDIMFALDVLEHVPDPIKALRESMRVLKGGGILIVSVPTEPKALRLVRDVRALFKETCTSPHWQGEVKSCRAFASQLANLFRIVKKVYYPLAVLGEQANYDCFFVCENQPVSSAFKE